MTVVQTNDPCWSLFNANAIEVALQIRRGARVLEIGCAEANWLTPMAQARPDVYLTGIDSRECQRPGAAIVTGNVLTHQFEPNFFDLVLLISTLEHIGLGYYGDGLAEDGDRLCLKRVYEWLKPGALLYFDVPFYKNSHVTTKLDCRVYDELRLNWLLEEVGYLEMRRRYGLLEQDPPVLSANPPVIDGPDILDHAPKDVVACWWRKPDGLKQGESS